MGIEIGSSHTWAYVNRLAQDFESGPEKRISGENHKRSPAIRASFFIFFCRVTVCCGSRIRGILYYTKAPVRLP